MNETKVKSEQPELLAAIKNSISDARQVVKERKTGCERTGGSIC